MPRILSLFAIVFIITTEISAQQSNELVAQGNQKIKEKNYKGAAVDFMGALNAKPNDTIALSGIIKAYTLMEQYSEALKWIASAQEVHPDNPEFFYRKGIVYNLTGEHEKALAEFETSLEKKPYNDLKIQILLNKASAEFKLEKLNEALTDYNKVIELDPRNINVYTYRGLVNFRLNYYIDAVNDYSKAIDLDPRSASSYYNRGMSLLKLNEKQKACADFLKACQMGYLNSCKIVVAECNTR